MSIENLERAIAIAKIDGATDCHFIAKEDAERVLFFDGEGQQVGYTNMDDEYVCVK